MRNGDDTIQPKPHTDEKDLIAWHYDQSQNRSVKGINLLNGVYHTGGVSLPLICTPGASRSDGRDAQGKLLGQSCHLSGLAYNLGTIATIISEETMCESSVVQHFTEKALNSRERAVEDLLDVLAFRFGLAASAPLVARIGAIKGSGSSSCTKPLAAC